MQPVAALRESQNDGLIATSIATPAVSASKLTVERVSIAPNHPLTDAARLPTSGVRTIVHTYEPIRNSQHDVVDFRLSFDCALAPEASRSFLGVQVVQCGPSVAPGEIFHTLKRVLETGETHETVTRHVHDDHELCFYQTASKFGDAVTTTTSIVSIR